MRKGYRSIIAMSFILFEVLYVMSILASGNVPAFITDNSEMIFYAFLVFNIISISALIF